MAFFEIAEQVDDLRLDRDVQGRDRLVAHDKRRGQGQGPGHGHPLALAARELVGKAAGMGFAALASRCRTLALVCLAVCLLPGCGRSDAPEVRLGFVATFSGEGFRAGRDALDAARFAVETASREGRPILGDRACRIRLYVRDDKDSPEGAARAVRELVARERVTAILGPFSSEAADAAAKAAEAAGVPLVAPAATAQVVTAGRPHIFRIAFTDAFQGMNSTIRA